MSFLLNPDMYLKDKSITYETCSRTWTIRAYQKPCHIARMSSAMSASVRERRPRRRSADYNISITFPERKRPPPLPVWRRMQISMAAAAAATRRVTTRPAWQGPARVICGRPAAYADMCSGGGRHGADRHRHATSVSPGSWGYRYLYNNLAWSRHVWRRVCLNLLQNVYTEKKCLCNILARWTWIHFQYSRNFRGKSKGN